MPARLRPTADIAADAILVGDPGRALMLAQELLQEPKMSNHARGLWGYTGVTPGGHELTIQSTGMGGPSATVVLRDLAELGVRRAIRIGTGTALSDLDLGRIMVVEEALESRGSLVRQESTKEPRDPVRPEPVLTARMQEALEDAPVGTAISLDRLHDPERGSPAVPADVADMQTAALLEAGRLTGVAVAVALIVTESSEAGRLGDEQSEEAARRAGRAAARVLSS